MPNSPEVDERKEAANVRKVYLDPANPAGLGGLKRLKKAFPAISLPTLRRILRGTDAYTLHKPVRWRFRRTKIISKGIHDLYQMDLADMQQLARHNGGIKFLLVVIDVFTKMLHVKTLKTKKATEVAKALEPLIKKYKPKFLNSDPGGEFNNYLVKRMLTKYNTHYYPTRDPTVKAAVAERVIRTLKNRIYRYMTSTHGYKYAHVLPQIVDAYNKSFHRSIGMKPVDVTPDTEDRVRQKLYPPVKGWVKFRFAIGQRVKLVMEPGLRIRGFQPGWSRESFFIKTQIPSRPPRYTLEDEKKEAIVGSFYEPELQHVDAPEEYRIAKILHSKKVKGKTLYKVRWAGYGPQFDSYVTREDIVKR